MDAKEESKILENSILEADFNSGQFFGLIDLQDHATEIANASPNNLASWQVDMDEKQITFTISLEPSKNLILAENYYNQLPTGSLI